MRILIYGINFAPELTGVGKYSGEMAEWLSVRGHEVRVVTAPPYYPQWKVGKGYKAWQYRRESLISCNHGPAAPPRKNQLRIYRCPLWIPGKLSGLKRLVHLASFALSSFPLMLRHVFWRPDVVWVVEPALMCAPGAWVTARLCGAKVWLHVQDFEIDAAFDLGLVQAPWLKMLIQVLERFLMLGFDKVSTISPNMQVLLGKKGVPQQRIELFPNWVDTNEITPLTAIHTAKFSIDNGGYKSEWAVAAKTLIVMYAGNMGEKQGLELVVEAARELSGCDDICFVMCGEGAAYSRLRKLADGLANIRWIPLQPIERLNELLNTADIHLLPQRASAADLVMPSKLTGIFASGRPVVATAVPGTALFMAVEGRGVLVPPGDPEKFSAAILALATNPSLRDLYGQAAREYAIRNLDKEVILSNFESALEKI